MTVPYDELDPPIVDLVRALNELPGIRTVESCAGHEVPLSVSSCPAGRWEVYFVLTPGADSESDPEFSVPTAQAWLTLEFVAWLADAHSATALSIAAAPPWINGPGRSLAFCLHGTRAGEGGAEPSDVARFIRDCLERGLLYEHTPGACRRLSVVSAKTRRRARASPCDMETLRLDT